MPAQLTTFSHWILPSPSGDRHPTEAARRPLVSMDSTFTFSNSRAPLFFAPRANAIAIFEGSPWPSLSRYTAEVTSEVFRCGYRCFTSAGEISSISTPNALAIETERRSSSRRSSVKATVIEPQRTKPVATPVSSSSVPYNSCEYLANFVMLAVARSCAINPAACQVVPDVSFFRSSRTTSVQPSFARWYATEHPTMPPPIITALADSGTRSPVI